MKKSGILHAELARVIASLGHGQRLVIGDAGLPVPPKVRCIDLAVTLGVPGFWPVLDAVLTEMTVERAVIAEEASPEVRTEFEGRLPVEVDSHEALKAMSVDAQAVIRTGEATPFTNVVLIAGVAF